MDSQEIVYIALAGVALAGLVIGRWWTLALPLAIVPVVYLGLYRGWWGSGLGDGWGYAAALALAIAVALAAAGVVARTLAQRVRLAR